MKTQKIKRSDLQKLWKIACPGWKEKIAELVLFESGEELQVNNSDILKAHSEANSEQKKLIEKFFTILDDSVFAVKTYSEVCKRLGIKELTVKDFKQFGDDALKMLSFHQIKNLEKFYNEGWILNWKDQNQYKHYPYFTISRSGGLVFGAAYYSSSSFYGRVGFYKDEKTARFIGQNEEYIKIYQNLM